MTVQSVINCVLEGGDNETVSQKSVIRCIRANLIFKMFNYSILHFCMCSLVSVLFFLFLLLLLLNRYAL